METNVQMNAPAPYMTLECLGEYFLYSTASNMFFQIDRPTYCFLELLKHHSLEEAQAIMLSAGEFPESTILEVIHDVKEYIRQGMFKIPDFTVSQEHFEKQLEQRYSTSWNKLELALAENCNLACKYCYCGTCRDMPMKGLMTKEVAQKAISWLFSVCGNNDTVSITFFGGEPLLNKPVLRFAIEYSQKLAELHQKKVFYSMTTNGTLLDDEVISYIKRYNFGLMVSLDGPQEIHDQQCPTQDGRGSHALAVAGIKKLMARRRAVTVRCTMTHPAPNIMDLVRYFDNFGFTRIVLGRTVNPVNPSPVDFTEEDFLKTQRQEREEVIPWVLETLAQGKKPKYFPYAKFISDQESGQCPTSCSPFRCGACRGTTTVSADGTLYPCHRFVGMQAWQIGSIFTGPNLTKCKDFWRKYHASVAPHCEKCEMWLQCHGPCPWEIAKADGSFELNTAKCKKLGDYLAQAVYVYNKDAKRKKLQMQ